MSQADLGNSEHDGGFILERLRLLDEAFIQKFIQKFEADNFEAKAGYHAVANEKPSSTYRVTQSSIASSSVRGKHLVGWTRQANP